MGTEAILIGLTAAAAGASAYTQKRQQDKQERAMERQQRLQKQQAEKEREQLEALQDARSPNDQSMEKRRKALASGRSDTILTSPLGASGTPQTQKKTLLGQ